jgi:hypothetical protein
MCHLSSSVPSFQKGRMGAKKEEKQKIAENSLLLDWRGGSRDFYFENLKMREGWTIRRDFFQREAKKYGIILTNDNIVLKTESSVVQSYVWLPPVMLEGVVHTRRGVDMDSSHTKKAWETSSLFGSAVGKKFFWMDGVLCIVSECARKICVHF